MRSEFRKIFQEIQADPDNATFTKQGIEPLYYASSSARINIIGQAPGRIAQKKMKFWGDPSGYRLRAWLGVSRDIFYNSEMIAILPMGFSTQSQVISVFIYCFDLTFLFGQIKFSGSPSDT